MVIVQVNLLMSQKIKSMLFVGTVDKNNPFWCYCWLFHLGLSCVFVGLCYNSELMCQNPNLLEHLK